jgi:N,N'-diacetyllegionaminate synthase
MTKTYIIAEAGVNHNGNVEIAKKMIDCAAEAGVNVVKFQNFKTEHCISKFAPKAEYQKETTGHSETQFEMVKKLELSEEVHRELFDYCQYKGITYLSTPGDLGSIDFLNRLGLDSFKIPSGEVTNWPYLMKVGGLKKKIILSSGMSDLGEIEDAIEVLIEAGTLLDQITVLHCNTEYPTPLEDVNLKAMKTIAAAFPGVGIGYSDHSASMEVPIAAVAMGAEVIEKHFTLDKNMEGPDHLASLNPDELKAMVQGIRNIEIALGSALKRPSPSELKNKPIARKSIVANKKINKNEVFTEFNLSAKRPGTGISPMKWQEIIGKKAGRDFQEDEMIEL